MNAVLTDAIERALIDHVLKTASYTQPTIYLALFTDNPGEAGSLTNEVANANGYARVACANWAAASARAISNTGTTSFPTVTGAGWGTVTHVGIVDSGTHGAGNVLAYVELTTPKTVTAGAGPQFAAGQIVLTWVTGAVSTYLANKLLDHLLRKATGGTSYTVPTHIKIGLSTVSPGDTGTMSSPSGGSYAHTQHDTWHAAATDGSNVTTATNDGVCTFPTATGSWGTCTYWAILDESSNVLIYAALTSSITVASGDTPGVADEAIVVGLD